MTEPTTLDLSKAADYLLVCKADSDSMESDDRAASAYLAALDLWEALTGLTGDAALDYARAIRETGAKAAPIPF